MTPDRLLVNVNIEKDPIAERDAVNAMVDCIRRYVLGPDQGVSTSSRIVKSTLELCLLEEQTDLSKSRWREMTQNHDSRFESGVVTRSDERKMEEGVVDFNLAAIQIASQRGALNHEIFGLKTFNKDEYDEISKVARAAVVGYAKLGKETVSSSVKRFQDLIKEESKVDARTSPIDQSRNWKANLG